MVISKSAINPLPLHGGRLRYHRRSQSAVRPASHGGVQHLFGSGQHLSKTICCWEKSTHWHFQLIASCEAHACIFSQGALHKHADAITTFQNYDHPIYLLFCLFCIVGCCKITMQSFHLLIICSKISHLVHPTHCISNSRFYVCCSQINLHCRNF